MYRSLQLDELAFEPYRRIFERVGAEITNRLPRSIGITSARPGEGKTTAAIGLALAAAAGATRRVLVIDGNLESPAIAARLRLSPKPGLSEALAGGVSPSEITRTATAMGFSIIPGGAAGPRGLELLCGRRIGVLIAELKRTFDLIILDLPHVRDERTAEAAARLCDDLFVVTQMFRTRRELLERAIRLLEAARASLRGCILTHAPADVVDIACLDAQPDADGVRCVGMAATGSPQPPDATGRAAEHGTAPSHIPTPGLFAACATVLDPSQTKSYVTASEPIRITVAAGLVPAPIGPQGPGLPGGKVAAGLVPAPIGPQGPGLPGGEVEFDIAPRKSVEGQPVRAGSDAGVTAPRAPAARPSDSSCSPPDRQAADRGAGPEIDRSGADKAPDHGDERRAARIRHRGRRSRQPAGFKPPVSVAVVAHALEYSPGANILVACGGLLTAAFTIYVAADLVSWFW